MTYRLTSSPAISMVQEWLAIAQSLAAPVESVLEAPDSPCYVRQSDGTVIDLSSWCVKTPPTVLSPSASFVSNFRSLAKNYPPNIRQELNQYSDKHGASAIASAKTTCRVLRYGGAQAELTRRRALAAYNSSSSEVAKQQIIPSCVQTYNFLFLLPGRTPCLCGSLRQAATRLR